MKFYDLIDNTNKDIDLYVDMDGVLAEYDIGNFSYDTIRPLKSNIKRIFELQKRSNVNIYILSVCKTNNIVLEKIEWIKKHMAFFHKDNCIFLSKEENEGITSKELKSNYLKNNSDKNKLNIVVDDDIEIIKYIKNNNDVNVFHVSSWID